MLELIKIQMEQRCNKVNILGGGYFFIEKFDGEREEEDRAKIYDEFGGYLDYFNLDGKTKEEYNNYIDYLKNSKSFDEFIDKIDLKDANYLYQGSNVKELLLSFSEYFTDEETEEKEELYERIEDKNWNEQDLIERYNIQKIDGHYFIIVY